MNTTDISWLNLFLGSLTIIIPFAIFSYYRTKLSKTMLFSFFRMSIQLILVGFYLKYIFQINSLLINLLWILVMMTAATFSIIRRSEIKNRKFYFPIIVGLSADVLINILIYSTIIIDFKEFFTARYLIPISGMVIGNCITNSIIALKSFYGGLQKNQDKYKYLLNITASRKQALFPFLQEALKTSFAPTIASNATIGLIWLPGIMTGQILGGSDPLVAIKYQIMIVLSIFIGNILTVFLTLFLSSKYAFDENDFLTS